MLRDCDDNEQRDSFICKCNNIIYYGDDAHYHVIYMTLMYFNKNFPLYCYTLLLQHNYCF